MEGRQKNSNELIMYHKYNFYKRRKRMKTRITICLMLMLGVLLSCGGLAQPVVASNYVYIDDGASHVIGDATYQNSNVILDYHIANTPGTHFNIVNGGNISSLVACNNSTIEVDGGLISYGINVNDNGKIGVNGGTIGTIWAYDHSSIAVNGGVINGWILACDNSMVEIRGGLFANLSDLMASSSGTIYLYGSSFRVGGVELNYGDSLRDYGVVGGPNLANLTGIITGTLLDGSVLNCEFFVPRNNPGGADIIVIPEPLTSTLLLTAGVFLLRRRR
jgi:hypothetical protein